MSLRDQILSSSACKSEAVEVPEWSTTVHVRELTAAERDALEASVSTDRKAGRSGLDNFRARVLVKSLTDGEGNRIFADDDAEALGAMPAAPIDRLFDVAARLSGLTSDAVEDAAKN